jgi:hypothetical protein
VTRAEADSAWATETVTGLYALQELRSEWDELHARSVGVTPFQAHGWVEAWWTEYGGAGRLRVLLVRRDGRLVAAAPLALTRRGPVRVLAPLGGAQSDHHDVLLDVGSARPAAGRLAAALAALPGWDVLDLAAVRAGAGAEQLADAWAGDRWWAPGPPRAELLVAHRTTTTVGAVPVTVRAVPATDVPAAVGRLLALPARGGRPVPPEHRRPRFARHLAGALTAMVDRGQAVLTEFTVAGRVVAVDVELVGRDFAGLHLAGSARGPEPGDVAMVPGPGPDRRLLLGRGPAARAYAAAVRLRATAPRAGD